MDTDKIRIKELEDKISNYQNSLVSIYDYVKMLDRDIINNNIDIDTLQLNDETISEMFFRNLSAYDVDLNKDLGWDHLKPISKI